MREVFHFSYNSEPRHACYVRKSWRPLKYRGPPPLPPSARICRRIHGDWAHARWGYSGHPPWNTPRGGFSCWHTRAVGWAVSVAFTFLPKIEGYGGGSRSFFLYLSSSSPSSFFTFLLLLLFFFFRFSLSFSIYVLSCCYFLRFLFLSHFRAVLAGLYVFKFLLRCVRYRAYMRGCRKAASETVHVSKQQKTSESVAVPAIRCSDSIPEILFVVYIFWKPSRVEEFSSDLNRFSARKVPGKSSSLGSKDRAPRGSTKRFHCASETS